MNVNRIIYIYIQTKAVRRCKTVCVMLSQFSLFYKRNGKIAMMPGIQKAIGIFSIQIEKRG